MHIIEILKTKFAQIGNFQDRSYTSILQIIDLQGGKLHNRTTLEKNHYDYINVTVWRCQLPRHK